MRLIGRVASLEAQNQPSPPCTVIIIEAGHDEADARAVYEEHHGQIDPRGLTVLIHRLG